MSISRRQFLIGSATTIAGLTVPAYLTKAATALQQTGSPLILPKQRFKTLYARTMGGGEYEFHLGSTPEPPPTMTFSQFAKYTGYCNFTEYVKAQGYYSVREFREKCGVRASDEVSDEMVIEASYGEYDDPPAQAYRFLDSLDLGPTNGTGEVGELLFIDGEYPGSDYLGVTARGDNTLVLLQTRLVQLDAGIRIEAVL